MAAKKKSTKTKASKKVAAKKLTHVAIVLDRSGSMSTIHKETVDGLNTQIAALQKAELENAGEIRVSLVQFDNVIDVVFAGRKPSEIKEFGMNDFQPRWNTAMYDGIWAAMNLLKTQEVTDDTAYLLFVISDGEENASREITQQALTDEIKRLQDLGNWTFNYILANVDINKIRTQFHANANSVATYTANSVGSTAAYGLISTNSLRYMSTRGNTLSESMNESSVGFTDAELKTLSETK